jgi:hypothetical protein
MSKDELIKVLENYDKNGITHDTKLIIDDDKDAMTRGPLIVEGD